MKRILSSALAAVAMLLAPVVPASAETTAIVGAGYVDVLSGRSVDDAVVVIENGRIAAIGPAGQVRIPAGARQIELRGKWLAPGLFNTHVHLGLVLPGLMAAEHAAESEAQLTLRMADNARKSLLSGVTTIRTTGDPLHADIALARAIDRGTQAGPRIVSAGQGVTITGGHGAGGRLANDGPDEVSKITRHEISSGAQWIKIAVSGGIATPGGGLADGLMTPAEIKAVVDIAKRNGRKVTAHSGSASAAREAVELGVNGIEHGYFLDQPTLRLMKQRGAWFVPTIVVSQPATFEFFKRIGSPDWYMARVREVGKDHWQALQTAIREGVNISLGSDQFPFEPNDGTTATIREAEYYREAGMSHLQAMQAATIQSARMLEMDGVTGLLTVGKFADIIALDANPLDNISALRSLGFVMKGGRVYRNDWDAAVGADALSADDDVLAEAPKPGEDFIF